VAPNSSSRASVTSITAKPSTVDGTAPDDSHNGEPSAFVVSDRQSFAVLWLNTPGDRPLSLAGLHGRVVLIDFWTYSCINCQRTLPHLEAWYRAYQRSGLEIIGVHTPEFAFEHVTSNVTAQAHTLGVRYPIAIDDDYGTRRGTCTWSSAAPARSPYG
jgi:thiol-disulfide isomerase/thioredoxin